MKNNNYYFFIFFIFILINNCASDTINGIIISDYTCISNLINKLGLSTYFPSGVVCVNPITCDGTTDCGLYVLCDPNSQKITSFKLQSKDANKIISDTDINCFSSLDSFTLIAVTLDQNFLNKVNNTKSIFINRGVVPAFSTSFHSNINSLTFNISSSFSSKMKLSYLQYLKNFSLYASDSYYPYVNIYLENDLTTNLKLENLEIIASNLVSLQLLSVTNLTFSYGAQFSVDPNGSNSPNSYFSTFNNIENIYLKQPIVTTAAGAGFVYSTKTFPRELSTSSSNLVSFISEVPYSQESTNIDFSGFTKLKYLSLTKVGSSFHNGFKFPFSKFSSSLKSFTFTGGNLTIDNFDFTIFNNLDNVILSTNNITSNLPIFNGKNISNFDLSFNSIKNNIDNSWCNTNLIIGNNQLNGTVPTCFSTFFCIDKVYKSFVNNPFTTAIINTCGSTTLPGTMKIVGSNTILYGRDLGLGSDFLTSTPSFAWKPLEISDSYYIENYNTPTNFTFTFLSSPSKSFKLSSGDNLPFISSYGIGGTFNSTVASLTMSGAYFSYNTSAIELSFNSIGCIISFSSFEMIGCRVKEYESFYSGGTIQITILKINDKQTQYMTNTTLNTNQNPKLCDSSSCGYFNKQGTCQIDGTCLCNPKWKGSYCQYENIYIDSITPSNQYGGTVSIFGWFTNIHNNLQVKIDNTICTLISSTDSQILCLAQPGLGTKTLTITQNSNQVVYATYVYNATCPNNCSGNGKCSSLTGVCSCDTTHQSNDCSLPFKQCPINLSTGELCSGSLNTCNNQTGVCICDSSYQSSDCSLPFKQCPINLINGQICSGPLNTCNNQTGLCTCDSSHQSNDCSLPFKQCPIASISSLVCNGPKYGNCLNTTGICSCLSDWTGIDCVTPNHYCSSITPAPTTGNINITLYGWFGYENNDLKVTIGGNDCPVISVDSSSIKCTVAPGSEGITSVNITQNLISFFAKDRFQYYSVEIKERECPNACGGNGNCDKSSGVCLCNKDFSGFDCSAYSPTEDDIQNSSESSTTGTTSTPKPTTSPSQTTPPKSSSSINNSSSIISISNEQTNYNLLIVQLVELDINGKLVISYPLKDSWKFDSDSSNKTIYKFNQQLNNLNNPDNNTWINSTIEEVQKNRIQEFAGIQFLLEKSTIKVSIEIENYIFSNNLNTLQLQIESSIDILDDYKGSNQCNNDTTNVSESNLSNLNLNYLKIVKNSKVLYGRFINTILADSRPTFISSGIIDNSNDTLIIGLNLPHASNIIVDPDFSVLVDKSYKSSCDAESQSKTWVLPVSIVVPCVAVASLIVIGAIIYRRHHVSILLAKDKYKFSLKNLSKKNNDELYLS